MGRPKKKPPPPVTLTGPEIRAARETLGLAWGKGEALNINELAALLRLSAATITHYESGSVEPPGPVCVCIRMMLAGAHPPDMLKILRL
jgi:DNA-binding transcriptional regulator YiaG